MNFHQELCSRLTQLVGTLAVRKKIMLMRSQINRRRLIKASLAVTSGSLLASKSFAAPLYRFEKTVAINKVRIWEKALSNKPDLNNLKARLLANENPYGPSQSAKQAIIDNVLIGNRYGHMEAKELIAAIAEKEGVPKDYILLGPGSSDLLEKTAIVMFKDGGNIIAADPSYMSLIKTALYFNADLKSVPLTETYAHDLEKMKMQIDPNTKLVYVCNPNNPTGTLTSSKDLMEFCNDVSETVPVFVDEAYLEFLPDDMQVSMVDLLAKDKDVIVSRTFSKIHGMAGLRVGYIVALPSTIEKITEMSRPNMGMNITSILAAHASLNDINFQKMSRKKNTECRDYICQVLSGLDISYIPSHTSFMMFPLPMNGELYLEKMFDHGVGVRLFEIDKQPWCRVSMGTMEEMKLFATTLKSVLA